MSLKKSAKAETPHAIFANRSGWVWRVLKVYQAPKQECTNKFARWLCYVTSPHTMGGADIGDTYKLDVTGHATLVACSREWAEAYTLPAEVSATLPDPVTWIAAHGGQS
jgi:glyoxylate carboligase